MFDAVGIDTPCIDLNASVADFPRPNDGESLLDTSWQGGGKVASGMAASARLGAKCAMTGTVGDDIYGRFCAADFTRHGIDTRYLYMREGANTGLSIVISDLATRGRSICHRGTNASPLTVEELPVEYLQNTKFLYLCHLGKTDIAAANIARAAGAKVLFDADYYNDELGRNIGLIDVFIGSETVYGLVFGDDKDYEKNCKALTLKGPGIVVFTFGGDGCVGYSEATGYFEEPTFDVPVIDTVGAGDVYHGAYLVALLQGWDARRAARFSNAVSSIKCTRIGGRAGVPDMKTVLTFMETGVIDYDEIDRRVEFYRRGLDHV